MPSGKLAAFVCAGAGAAAAAHASTKRKQDNSQQRKPSHAQKVKGSQRQDCSAQLVLRRLQVQCYVAIARLGSAQQRRAETFSAQAKSWLLLCRGCDAGAICEARKSTTERQATIAHLPLRAARK